MRVLTSNFYALESDPGDEDSDYTDQEHQDANDADYQEIEIVIN